MSSKPISANALIALLAILALATTLRMTKIGEDPLWLDEKGHLEAATAPNLSSLFEQVSRHAAATPMDYLLLRIYIELTGAKTLLALRIPYVIYGILTIFFAFMLGRQIHNTSSGLLSAYFLAISFTHIYYSQEIRFYALSALIGTVNTWVFLSVWKNPAGWKWLVWGFLCVLGLYTHYYLGMLFIIQVGWLFLQNHAQPSQTASLVSALTALGISALLFLPWVLWSQDLALRLSFEAYIPFLSAFRVYLATLGPPLALLIFGPFGLFRKSPAPLLLSLIFLPFIGAYAIDNMAGYFFNARQLIFAVPLSICLGSASLTYFTQSVQLRSQDARLSRVGNFAIASLTFAITVANSYELLRYYSRQILP